MLVLAVSKLVMLLILSVDTEKNILKKRICRGDKSYVCLHINSRSFTGSNNIFYNLIIAAWKSIKTFPIEEAVRMQKIWEFPFCSQFNPVRTRLNLIDSPDAPETSSHLLTCILVKQQFPIFKSMTLRIKSWRCNSV